MAGARAVGLLISGVALLAAAPAAPALVRDTAPYAEARDDHFFYASYPDGDVLTGCEDDRSGNRCSHSLSASAATGTAAIDDAILTADNDAVSTAGGSERRWESGEMRSRVLISPESYVTTRPVNELTFVIRVTVHEMSLRMLGHADADDEGNDRNIEADVRSGVEVWAGCHWPDGGLGCGTTVKFSSDLPRAHLRGFGEVEVPPGRYSTSYRTAGPFPAGVRMDFHVGPACDLRWQFIPPLSSLLLQAGFDYGCRMSVTLDSFTVREHGGE